MTREELIGYCRYYKGEDGCPFEKGPQTVFWKWEKMYVQANAGRDEPNGWEEGVKRYCRNHPKAENIYTDKSVSIHTRGIAYFIEQMSAKWMPYGPNLVFKY